MVQVYNLGTLEGGRSMSAEYKALARRYFEEAWNLQKPAVLDQIIAKSAIDHDPANPSLPPGPDGQKQLFAKYKAAFPDSQFTLGAIIAEGDLVAVRWSVRGTHQGTLEGLAATGKQVNLTGTTTMRVVGGKIAEMWNNWDALGLLQQLGIGARAQGA
jgi:steroid delta-isomerase-like uncharacterized protein